MGRIVILLAAIVVIWLLSQWLKTQFQTKGRPFAVKAFLAIVAVVFVALAVTGRVHWVGALLASLLAGLRFALPLLIRSLPFLQQIHRAHADTSRPDDSSNHQQTPASADMSVTEALNILGLKGNPSRDKIIEAHRQLIQKNHPDRGGNDYLAAKINTAKDLLLKHFG